MEEARQRHGEASLSLLFPSFLHPDAVIGSSRFYLLKFEGNEKGRKLCNRNNDPFYEQELQGPQQCASEQGVLCFEEIEECTAPAETKRLARCWWRQSERGCSGCSAGAGMQRGAAGRCGCSCGLGRAGKYCLQGKNIPRLDTMVKPKQNQSCPPFCIISQDK